MSAVVNNQPDRDHQVHTGDYVDGQAPEVHEAADVNLHIQGGPALFFRSGKRATSSKGYHDHNHYSSPIPPFCRKCKSEHSELIRIGSRDSQSSKQPFLGTFLLKQPRRPSLQEFMDF